MLDKFLGLFRASAAIPVATALADGTPVAASCDYGGILLTRLTTGAGGLLLTGSTPGTDGIGPTGINALDEKSYLYGFNGISWDRLRTLADNSDAQAALTLGLSATVARLEGFNGATFDRLRSLADNADGQAALTLGLLATMARQQVWNGANWDRARTPNVFKTASATAVGNTTLWTPAAGKKFRLMGYSFLVTGDATLSIAGEVVVQLLDGANPIGISFSPFVNSVTNANIAAQSVPFADLKNGYLSTTANNVLNVSLGATLTTGNFRFNVFGTEE